MKKNTVRALAVILLAGLALGPGQALAEAKAVKITAIVEHPALDSVRKGVIDELAAQGFKDGDAIAVEFQSAQGDVGIAGQIAQKFVGDGPAVIVPISTPSAQAVAAAAKGRVPVVFSAVTDPVAAKLVPEWKKPGANITGVSDLTPLDKQLDVVKRMVPSLKNLGVPYNPGEANSVVLLNKLKDVAQPKGITIIGAAAPSSNDVLQAGRSLVGKVDAMFVTTDNTVVSALEALVKVGTEAKLPLFAADTASVDRGAVAAVGFDYYDIGRQTGAIVARVLKGEKPGDIPVEGVEKLQLHLNARTAKAMGIALPEDLAKQAAKVVE
ncbi:MAG TPA: ABC transporter substrate-binding protein [Azospirillaceae bacterium]|nr:ABC transporter substrate-binding protein [Azospirillaceae bacterium]